MNDGDEKGGDDDDITDGIYNGMMNIMLVMTMVVQVTMVVQW